MVVGGLGRDMQASRDLLVAKSFDQQSQDIHLAVRETKRILQRGAPRQARGREKADG